MILTAAVQRSARSKAVTASVGARHEQILSEPSGNQRRLDTLKEMRIEGEIDRLEYLRRKEVITADVAPAEARLGVLHTGQGTQELLARIDQVADVIAGGNLRQQKEVLNTVFARLEQQDGQIGRLVLDSWARGLV